MRTIRQPGRPHPDRVAWVEARAQRTVLDLAGGRLLLDAVAGAFAAMGARSGMVDIGGLHLAPFAYVMPALSKTPDHAAFYSDVRATRDPVEIVCGSLTFGKRDGAPFFHAHALWREGDGPLAGGHILPDRTALFRASRVPAIALSGASFRSDPDPETGFTLFGPVAEPDAGADGSDAFALRLRPNQDMAQALETFCRERGIARASLFGGVGSLIGARFDDGRAVEPFATEVAVTSGTIDAAGETTAIDVAMVDYTGGIATGRLKPGDNPVLMTFECVLLAQGGPQITPRSDGIVQTRKT